MALIARPWDRNSARERMAAWLDHFRTMDDGRAVFLETYMEAADRLTEAATAGAFLDAQWVADLAEHVADYYFLTIEPDIAEVTTSLPRAWAAAHAFAERPDSDACALLLLALNAHINIDLPRAVCEMLSRDWPVPRPMLDYRRADVYAFTTALINSVDARCGIKRIASAWRIEVWEHGLSLLTAADRPWRRGIVESIECTANRRAHLLVCDIDGRDDLLRLRAHELQLAFPQRHLLDACRLTVEAPMWGRVTLVGD